MAATRVSGGGDVIKFTAQADLDAGAIVVAGNLVGVVPVAVAQGELAAMELGGVWELEKASGQDFSLGERVYLDDFGDAVESATAANDYFGIAVEASGLTVSTVKAVLLQKSP